MTSENPKTLCILYTLGIYCIQQKKTDKNNVNRRNFFAKELYVLFQTFIFIFSETINEMRNTKEKRDKHGFLSINASFEVEVIPLIIYFDLKVEVTFIESEIINFCFDDRLSGEAPGIYLEMCYKFVLFTLPRIASKSKFRLHNSKGT